MQKTQRKVTYSSTVLKKMKTEPTLDNIEDDDEYELAADAFDEWLDEQDFEELED